MSDLPAYDVVRDEARSAISRIVEEMPDGTHIDPIKNGQPYGCASGGVFYTGQLSAFPKEGFDGEAFVAALPEALGSGFVENDLGIDVSFPAADFIATAYGDTAVGVTVIDNDGIMTIGITATSRCARAPE